MRLRITDREMTTRRQTLSGKVCALAMTVALCAVAESPGAAGLPLTDKLGGGDATVADAIDQARAQFAAGRYADAIQTLKVSAASGSNAEALVWLGRAHLARGRAYESWRMFWEARLLGAPPAPPGAFYGGGVAGTPGNAPTLADYQAAFDVIDREVDLFNLMVLPKDADHSDTMYRCAGRLQDAFDENRWSWRVKSFAYAQ